MKTNKLDIEQALFKDTVINKLAIVDYVKELEKENQELKVLLTNTALKDISRIAEIQEQYLKAVESVLDKVAIGELLDNTTKTELLQEIKSAIEKGKE